MDMEQITISITGKRAQEQTLRLMKAIYKTMARMNDRGCHITISSRRQETLQEDREIKIPEFMQENKGNPFLAGRMG